MSSKACFSIRRQRAKHEKKLSDQLIKKAKAIHSYKVRQSVYFIFAE